MKKLFEEATIEVRVFAVEDIMAYCTQDLCPNHVYCDNETPMG